MEEESSQASFWNEVGIAQEKISRLQALKKHSIPFIELDEDIVELLELLELAEKDANETTLKELEDEIVEIEQKFSSLRELSLFSGNNDSRNAFLSVHAGAGGTDACDWTEILLRMYSRWFDKKNFRYQLVDSLKDDEAGLRRATLYIEGDYAFGYLKSEIGVHRLVRLSPFDTNHKRHTSFASVDVVPEVEVEKIKINGNDLKIDTYSAGGPGGQH